MKICFKCRTSNAGFRDHCLVCASPFPLSGESKLEKTLRITIINGINRIIMVNQEVK